MIIRVLRSWTAYRWPRRHTTLSVESGLPHAPMTKHGMGCGSTVLWTKRHPQPPGSPPPRSFNKLFLWPNFHRVDLSAASRSVNSHLRVFVPARTPLPLMYPTPRRHACSLLNCLPHLRTPQCNHDFTVVSKKAPFSLASAFYKEMRHNTTRTHSKFKH